MLSHPTHRVCPPSQCTVIDELDPGLVAARIILRGKDPKPVLCLTPKNSHHSQQKHSTRHPSGNQYRTASAIGWNVSHDGDRIRGLDR